MYLLRKCFPSSHLCCFHIPGSVFKVRQWPHIFRHLELQENRTLVLKVLLPFSSLMTLKTFQKLHNFAEERLGKSLK